MQDTRVENEIIALAEGGDVESQIYLGYAYAEGVYEKNIDKAEYWLKCASEKNIDGLRRLVNLMVRRNKTESNFYINKLIEMNDMYGYYQTGRCFAQGLCGYKIDNEKALENFMIASKMGHLFSRADYYRYYRSNNKLFFIIRYFNLLRLSVICLFFAIIYGTNKVEVMP